MRTDVAFGMGVIAAGVLILLAGLATLRAAKPTQDCYFVTDRSGQEYASFEPTDALLTEDGAVVVFNTDEEWGFVYGPVSTRADKDCLRERGVDVPPLAGEDQ